MAELIKIFIILLEFSAILFSIILIIQIFSKKDRQIFSNRILSVFLLLNSYGITLFILISTHSISNYWHLYKTGIPTSMMVPSLVYLYIKSVLKDQTKIQRIDYIHIIPFIIGTIQYSPFYFLDKSSKIKIIENIQNISSDFSFNIGLINESYFTIIRVTIILFYIVLIIKNVLNLKIKEKENYLDKKIIKWLRIFGMSFSINHIIISFYLIFQLYVINSNIDFFNTLIGLLITVLFNGTLIYYSSYLIFNPETLIGIFRNNKQKNINLNESEFSKLENLILKEIKINKAYLDPSLNIDKFSRSINTKSRVISYFINNKYNKNFNQFINSYRINEAIRKIEDGYLNEYTIDALWQEIGFANRTTFYNRFKEETGLTPKQYLSKKNS